LRSTQGESPHGRWGKKAKEASGARSKGKEQGEINQASCCKALFWRDLSICVLRENKYVGSKTLEFRGIEVGYFVGVSIVRFLLLSQSGIKAL
jgi:hypothetical protein